MQNQSKSCPSCGCTVFKEIIGPQPGGHHGKVVCSQCDRYIKWIPKPSDQKAPDPRAEVSKKIVQKYSQGFCEICLKTETQIQLPWVLEAHHIIPVEKGGGDDADNIQICCTACHRLIHWQRNYNGASEDENLSESSIF
jgi:5-methylcytosine-specific restriction endonuclease McrA